jgi:Tweety
LISSLHFVYWFFYCNFSGAVAVGLYGNDDVHNGLVQVLASVASINEVFLSARNEVSWLPKSNQNATLKKRVILPLLSDCGRGANTEPTGDVDPEEPAEPHRERRRRQFGQSSTSDGDRWHDQQHVDGRSQYKEPGRPSQGRYPHHFPRGASLGRNHQVRKSLLFSVDAPGGIFGSA